MKIFRVLIALCALLALAIPAGASAFGGSRFFPQTGHTVQGRFLQYWDANGGLVQQGYPLTEERQEVNAEDGKIYTVQYFERAVFELHPENQPPYDVLLSLLGKEKLNGSLDNGGNNGSNNCEICVGVVRAKTQSLPLNADDNQAIDVVGPATLDVEMTKAPNGVGPALPNGQGTHDFRRLAVPAGTSMHFAPYKDAGIRVWQFLGGNTVQEENCQVRGEAQDYANQNSGRADVVVLYEGAPLPPNN